MLKLCFKCNTKRKTTRCRMALYFNQIDKGTLIRKVLTLYPFAFILLP